MSHTEGPKYGEGDILEMGDLQAIVLRAGAEMQDRCSTVRAYVLMSRDQASFYVQEWLVDAHWRLVKKKDGELLASDSWNKTDVIPMQVGWVIKRWNKPHGPVLWAGYFSGNPKMASCDEWMPLKLDKEV